MAWLEGRTCAGKQSTAALMAVAYLLHIFLIARKEWLPELLAPKDPY